MLHYEGCGLFKELPHNFPGGTEKKPGKKSVRIADSPSGTRIGGLSEMNQTHHHCAGLIVTTTGEWNFMKFGST